MHLVVVIYKPSVHKTYCKIGFGRLLSAFYMDPPITQIFKPVSFLPFRVE